MRYRTKLSQHILTSETAQKIIDYVSPLYGESYVGLWLFQAIGLTLDDVYAIAAKLRDETNPITTDILLDYWEDHYALPRNSSYTNDQRRARLLAKILDRGPCNPERLAAAVSAALGGVPVEITENVAKNTFLVNIREVVDSIVPAIAVLERRKPAHLIYWLRVATQTVSDTDIKIAVAITRSESFEVEVAQ